MHVVEGPADLIGLRDNMIERLDATRSQQTGKDYTSYTVHDWQGHTQAVS